MRLQQEARLTMRCRDSLFLALQNMPYSALTAFEHSYFQQKWDECNGTPVVNQSSDAEWWIATPVIIATVAIILSLFHVIRVN